MLSTEMNVVACNGSGPPAVLGISIRPRPLPGSKDVLIKVVAAGLNRADILQRRGKYPPPPGASDILGMEVSGHIVALGDEVITWKEGDAVCALLAGGGYAEYVTVPAEHCLQVPANLSVRDAASLPEALVTVYANIIRNAPFRADPWALVHGGSSGIGTMAIQVLKALGVRVCVTVGSDDKGKVCRSLGADVVIDYNREDFVKAIKLTAPNGVDTVLDMVGGEYVNRNLECLAPGGRHVSIATQHGPMAEIDIRQVMLKTLTLTGSTLRGRTPDEKEELIKEIKRDLWPFIAAGKIKPVIFQYFPLKDAAEAHKVMENGSHIGKILLEVS